MENEVREVPLEGLLARAYETRRVNFPPRVEFVYPRRTLPLRSTGDTCPLNCLHCRGRYLKGMRPLEDALQGPPGQELSYLVSGASDLMGRVPHLERQEELARLARRGALNLHTGLVTEEEAAQLAQLARVVSFDFLVEEETIRDIYGLPASGEDYIRSYRFLKARTRVVPHLCLGLHRGKIRGEYRALEALKAQGAEALSFIVFTPTPGTPLEACAPPPVEEVARLLAAARLLFPKVPLYLGCLRPGGRYRSRLDCLALQAGINTMVHPAPRARQLAGELGLETVLREECCSR